MTREPATIDDRYRINQTSTAILASLFEVAEQYGTNIAADERVAISRRLADSLRNHSGPLTRSDVLGAFQQTGVRRPPNGFWRDLRDRLERVVG